MTVGFSVDTSSLSRVCSGSRAAQPEGRLEARARALPEPIDLAVGPALRGGRLRHLKRESFTRRAQGLIKGLELGAG